MMNTLHLDKKDDGFHLFTSSPGKYPILNKETLTFLTQTIDEMLIDDRIKYLILSNKGDSFCAGLDINLFRDAKTSQVLDIIKIGIDSANKIERSNKISIAAVSGYCLGGGTEIILAFDLILASPDAKFGLPEVKIGLIPGADGIKRLVRQIGKRRALELLITGKTIDAQEALKIGLINEIVPKQKLHARASELAQEISSKNPIAIKKIKELCADASDQDISASELKAFGNCLKSAWAAQAINAFLTKEKKQ